MPWWGWLLVAWGVASAAVAVVVGRGIRLADIRNGTVSSVPEDGAPRDLLDE